MISEGSGSSPGKDMIVKRKLVAMILNFEKIGLSWRCCPRTGTKGQFVGPMCVAPGEDGRYGMWVRESAAESAVGEGRGEAKGRKNRENSNKNII